MAKIRQEINFINFNSLPVDGVAPGGGTGTTNSCILLDTAQYSGTSTYYFEVIASTGATSGSPTIALRRKGTSTDDVVINIPVSTSGWNRYRSSSFTPPTGQTEYVVFSTAGVGFSLTTRAARLLVFQDTGTNPLTSTETQIEIGNQETGLTNTADSALTNPKYWYYDSSVWDGTLTCYAEVTALIANNMYNYTVKLQEDNGSFGGWTDKVTIASALTNSTATRTRSASFTPTTGRNYRIVASESNNMTNYIIYNAKIIVQQTDGTAITKLEPQYLLANTAVTATGLQDFDTYYDPAEWDGVTNVYYHEANNVSGGTSDAKLQSDPNGTPADVTNSTITNIIERERSSAMTMPGSAQTIDVNQTGT